MKRLRITVGDKTYDVLVEVLDVAGNPAGGAAASANPASVESSPIAPASVAGASVSVSSGQPGVVLSPLGGNVVVLEVAVGQEVQEGDQLVILEAMKMNTYIYAPEAGKIAEVFVKVGQAVQEGQPLVRIGG